MSSFMGRPRTVTDAQVTAILEWHRNHRTLKQLADELGLKVSTVKHVIAIKGQFKQPSPERRAAELAASQLQLRRRIRRGLR
jgi:hypothetical protein